MTKLQELQKLCADMFAKAESTESVSQMTELKNKVDEVSQEVDNLEKEKKEILDDYKDAVLHGGSTKTAPAPIVQAELSFENFLKDYEASKKP